MNLMIWGALTTMGSEGGVTNKSDYFGSRICNKTLPIDPGPSQATAGSGRQTNS